MGLFGGNNCNNCNNGGDWIWIVVIIVLILICCGDGGLFGGNNCYCEPCCEPRRDRDCDRDDCC